MNEGKQSVHVKNENEHKEKSQSVKKLNMKINEWCYMKDQTITSKTFF